MLIISLLYVAPPAEAGERLDTVVRPTAQRIDLTIDPAESSFDGSTTITFEVPRGEKVERFPMHGEGLTLGETTLRRTGGWRRHREFMVTIAPQSPDRLTVTPEKPLRAGTYELTVDYAGTLHEQGYGLYRFEHDGEPYVVSQLEADEARTAWPCFDEPSYKIPWTLTVTHPPGTVAISNAPIVQTRRVGDWQRDRFATTPPMPSYAVALAIGPYVATPVEGTRVPSRVWTTRGKEALAASVARDLPAIVDHLEAWFGQPYPYDKLDLVAAPKFPYGAMENPGAIVYREGLLFPPENATPAREHRLVEVSAHEVAHMWFGNLVTLEWWDDLWLNESFASFMGVHTLDALRPEARQDVARVARLTRMLARDGSPTARPVRTEVDGSAVFETTNSAAYAKGEALLDMVERWLGEEPFQAGIRTYLSRHQWGNASFDDLVGALQDVTGKPLAGMLAGYLDRPGAPQVALDTTGEALQLTQSRYARLGVELPAQLWDIPLRLRVGRTDGSTEVVELRMTEPTATLELGDDVAWVHPAADGIGYWVWVLDEPGTKRLVAAREQLTPAERRSIWSSLSLGLASGQLTAADVLRATEAFADEPDLAVRRAILRTADLTDTVRELDDQALLDRWFAWQRQQWRPWLASLGEATDDEPAAARELREALLGVLAEAGDSAVRDRLAAMGRRALENPASVPFDLLDEALGVLAERGDMALYERLTELADATDDTSLAGRYLYAAARIPQSDVRERALARALDADTPLRELWSLLSGVRSSHDDTVDDLVVDWSMEHYDAIVARVPPQARMRLARLGQGCDMARFERTVPFFEDEARRVPGTDRALAETREGVEQCLRSLEAREPSLREFLAAETAQR